MMLGQPGVPHDWPMEFDGYAADRPLLFDGENIWELVFKHNFQRFFKWFNHQNHCKLVANRYKFINHQNHEMI